jgi:hypothetical protein
MTTACQLNGDKTMSTAGKFMFCAAMFLCTAAEALAHTHRPHMKHMIESGSPSRVYRSFTHCTPSNRTDLSHLQRGDLAILIQDRGFRESNGSPFDEGECW